MKYLVLLLLLSGCVTISHKDAQGNETKYIRFGPQKLDNVILQLPDGSKVGFERQEADMTAVIDSLTAFLQELK